MAAFQNPEFYRAQAMSMSVWDTPRVIGKAENYPQHIALPRGCLDAALNLRRENGIASDIIDERFSGRPLELAFAGELRNEQESAAGAMLAHDAGVLCAPTAFGKTVTAAAIIASGAKGALSPADRSAARRQLRPPSRHDAGQLAALGAHAWRRMARVILGVRHDAHATLAFVRSELGVFVGSVAAHRPSQPLASRSSLRRVAHAGSSVAEADSSFEFRATSISLTTSASVLPTASMR